MTTDITELAPAMKAAAEKATPGEWRYLKTTPFMDAEISAANNTRVVNLLAGDVTEANSAFIALANPANVLALVEAVEKAQGMETYWKTQCRGITDHCEELQARIAELESRTVKLPAERFCPAEYAGSQLWSETEVWNKAITACADALRASGIKVEAE